MNNTFIKAFMEMGKESKGNEELSYFLTPI